MTDYNTRCHHYGEITKLDGTVIERTCSEGMDMDFCGKNCPCADTKPKTAGYQAYRKELDDFHLF